MRALARARLRAPCWWATGSRTAAARARPTRSSPAASCSTWCRREGLAARDVPRLRRRGRDRPGCGGRSGRGTLTAMRIGYVLFDSPFLLAPLAGVSDSPFRRLAREQGAAGVVTEMVSADGLVRGQQATLDTCAASSPRSARSACSSSARTRASWRRRRAALCDLPAPERPGLDRHQHGLPGAQGGEPQGGRGPAAPTCRCSRRSCARMVAASTLPVTAKTRLGWDDAVERRGRGGARARGRRGGGAARSTPARAREKFEGDAALGVIGEAQAGGAHPGDRQRRRADARGRGAHARETGCDGVMIGRAAFGDPWIFAPRARLLGARRAAAAADRGRADRLACGTCAWWSRTWAPTRRRARCASTSPGTCKRAAARRARARAGEPHAHGGRSVETLLLGLPPRS